MFVPLPHTLLLVKFLPGQSEQEIVVITPVEKQVSPSPPFLDKSQFLVQGYRGFISLDAGRIAFLVSSFPKRIPQQDAGGVYAVSFSPMGASDIQPHAERAVLAIPREKRNPADVVAVDIIDGKYDETVHVLAVGVRGQKFPPFFDRTRQFGSELQYLPGGAVQGIDEALFGVVGPQRAEADQLALPEIS
jgi:hypothetical protein